MRKVLRYLAEYLADLTFLCCYYMFDTYITKVTLSFNIVYVYFHSHFVIVIVLNSNYFSHTKIYFQPIYLLFRALNFL